jgi:hypothetical protein
MGKGRWAAAGGRLTGLAGLDVQTRQQVRILTYLAAFVADQVRAKSISATEHGKSQSSQEFPEAELK